MVEIAREVFGSRGSGKNPNSLWWNDKVKAVVRTKEGAWMEVMGARDEEAIERCIEA